MGHASFWQYHAFSQFIFQDYAFYQQVNSENKAAVMVRCPERQLDSCAIVSSTQVQIITFFSAYNCKIFLTSISYICCGYSKEPSHYVVGTQKEPSH